MYRPTTLPGIARAGLAAVASGSIAGALTGQGTGPSTGPLPILVAACFWPPRQGAAASGEERGPSSRAALSWHTARSQAGPRSSRARAWS
jgi:hypothetical protein